LYISILSIGTPNIDPLIAAWSKSRLVQAVLTVRYIIISSILLLLIAFITKKGFIKSFLKSIRPFTMIHAVLIVLIGIIVSNQISIERILTDFLNYKYAGSIGTIGISILTVLFLWLSTLMFNQVYDEEIDKISNKERLIPQGYISGKSMKKLGIVFAIIGVGLGFSLNIQIFILSLIAIALGILYSKPPVRLRNSIVSTTIIGLGSMIGFFIGYLTPAYNEIRTTMPPVLLRETSSLTSESLSIGLLIFVLLSIGPLLTDLKDYEGDKKSGVKTIYTVYGREKGVKIVSLLLLFAFMSPLLLFHDQIYDFLVFIPLALTSAIIFNKYAHVKLILSFYFPILIYCVIRWINLI